MKKTDILFGTAIAMELGLVTLGTLNSQGVVDFGHWMAPTGAVLIFLTSALWLAVSAHAHLEAEKSNKAKQGFELREITSFVSESPVTPTSTR